MCGGDAACSQVTLSTRYHDDDDHHDRIVDDSGSYTVIEDGIVAIP